MHVGSFINNNECSLKLPHALGVDAEICLKRELEAGMLLGIFIGINFLSSAAAFIAAGLHLRKLDATS